MTLSPELEAQILRYHHVEQWRIGTIARQLHVHHGSVERVLRQAGLPRIGTARPSRIDPWLPFIHATLEKFPRLTASRLYAMVRERGYVRDSFFAARAFADLADLNRQAEAWCLGQADDRLCPQDKTLTVREALAQEQPRLLALPGNPWPLEERVAVSVGKTPYVRFDLNDYSVPHTLVRKTLTVLADPERVRILDGQAVVASHVRSYDRGQQIEEPAHLAALVEHKAQARAQRGMTWLAQAVPASRALLTQAAERGDNLGAITATLGRLVARYGAAEVETAVRAALARGVPHPNAVRLALEVQREARDQPPPIAACLPAHVLAKDATVQPHRLDTYDQLAVASGEQDES